MSQEESLKRRDMKEISAQEKMKIQPRYVFSGLFEDILKRLPFKGLMRFKGVSHSFHALIKNPRFGLKQLSHYKQTNNNSINILLKYNNLTSPQTKLVQLSGADGDRLSVTELDLPQKTCGSLHPQEFSLVGHCNGVFCLCCPSNRCLCGSVILYNPTIRESKVVPQPSSSNYDKSQYSRRVKFGFGCDPKTNDLVVIMISSFVLFSKVKVEDFGKIKHYTLVEEYSLRTNSWREMKKYNDLFFIKNFWIYHKGVYYWTSEYKISSGREVILRFEFEGKALRLVQMPNVEPNSDSQTCLGVVHDSLALLCYNNAISRFDIWVMNHSGGLKDSWTKITSIAYKIPHGVWAFLVPWKGNEILLGMSTEKFIFYDLSTRQIKQVVPNSDIALGTVGPFVGLHAVNYVKSIISVKREKLA